MDFKKDDQVIVRRKIRSGNLVRMGSIVKIEGSNALVNFPIDHTQALIPLNSMEKTSQVFSGYSNVQASPVRRTIYPRKGLA